MKKFAKEKKNKDKEKEFISSIAYWGFIPPKNEGDEAVSKNTLLTGSWDSIQRVYDDMDPDEKLGKLREPIDRHSRTVGNKNVTHPINFLDLKPELSMTASASEDGTVVLWNHTSHKLEGRLFPNDPDPPSVLCCKFLKNCNCIVTADVEGYLNFYAIPPSYIKCTLLCRLRWLNEKE